MLLRSLDAATAAELLKGVNEQVVHELAVELAHLDAAGCGSQMQGLKLARQFCNSLQPSDELDIDDFLSDMLNSSAEPDDAEQIHGDVKESADTNSPFRSICSAEPETVAEILAGAHPLKAAIVLSEMPSEKTSEVLGFMDWGIRISIANRMSSCGGIGAAAKNRIAEVFSRSLDDASSTAACEVSTKQSKPTVRNLAASLRNLGKGIRNGFLGTIRGRDAKAGERVSDLTIFWDDILQISDCALRKALRRIDIRKLALALVRADRRFVQRIQSNIAEPMAARLNDQMLLFSAYRRKDVESARAEIVDFLREMNERGELTFVRE
jgi:flagellar motor switch protein FliG